jgi:hypothetical protein
MSFEHWNKSNDSLQFEETKELAPLDDLLAYMSRYAREKPGTIAVCCFVVGFAIGWKLKPW